MTMRRVTALLLALLFWASPALAGGLWTGTTGIVTSPWDLQFSAVLFDRLSVNSSGDLLFGATEKAPGAATVALAGLGAGNVNSGTHSYKITFITAVGETNAGTVTSTVTTTAGDGQVALSAIPTGSTYVTSRKVYRTAAGNAVTGPWLLLATIANNTATTYTDNTLDSSLTTTSPNANTAIDTRVTFANSGNVGIGTTSPQGALSIGSGQVLLPDGISTAPSLAFGNNNDMGLYRVAANDVAMATPGTFSIRRSSDGRPAFTFEWGGTSAYISFFSPITSNFLTRLSAADVAQLDLHGFGTASVHKPQAFKVYNYFSSGADYERVGLQFANDVAEIRSEADGSGVIRNIALMGGNVGIGTTSPTAYLNIKAGTATANTAPLKFTSGALNTTAEAGAIEFLTDAYYGTITTGAARKTFAFLESPAFTGTVTLPTPFTLGATSVTTTGTQLNYLNAATGTTGTTSTNLVFSTSPTLITPALGTPTALVLTNATGLPAGSVLAGSFGAGAYVISTSLQADTIELGHATDTTLARVSAGVASIEGATIATLSAANVFTATQTAPTINATTGFTKNSGPLLFGGLPSAMQNLTYVRGAGSNLAIGNSDIYTVPANRKALIGRLPRAYNPSAGSITFYGQIKVSGTYYRIMPDTVLTAGTGSHAQSAGTGIILNAGESIAVKTTTTAGLNIWFQVLEFDASDTGLQTARILGLSNGNNTLLTIPANKSAIFTIDLAAQATNPGNVQVENNSGGSLNYYVNVVPSGGSVASTNQLYPATAVADQVWFSFVGAPTMGAGDFLNINTSGGGAGQLAWVNYYLVP